MGQTKLNEAQVDLKSYKKSADITAEIAAAVSAHNTSSTAHADIRTAIAGKQDTLPDGTAGKFLKKTATGVEWAEVSGGGAAITVDSALSATSKNPVQNKVIKAALDDKQDKLTDAQVAAANSGATAAKVSGYDAHTANNDLHVSASQKAAWTDKQDAINDLATIRTNAAAGKSAADAQAAYGDVVSHNVSEFVPANHNTSSTAHADIRTAIAGKQDTLPDGTAGKFLKKTATGVEWAEVSGGNMENKADKDLSNCPANYDYVVESKYPTAADPSWYRKYKSGWLEQGGVAYSSSGDAAVTLLKPYADTGFTVTATNVQTDSLNAWGWVYAKSKTATGFTISSRSGSGSAVTCNAMWEAKGQGAE